MTLFISTLSFSSPLKIGVGVSGPPIVESVYTDEGRYYYGFCIDLMNEICKRIGESCVYQSITTNNQFELLDSGNIDLVILTRPYSSFDLKNYVISIPYAASKIHFLTLKSSPINDIADIKREKIGVIKDTFYKLLTETSFNNNNQIIAYNSTSDLFSDLAQNKIDVIVLNNAIAHNLVRNVLSNFKIVGRSIPLGEGYGIIALPDKAAIISRINKAILSIQRDGTYAAIYQKYYNPR